MRIADLVNPEPVKGSAPEAPSPPYPLKTQPEIKARRAPKMRGKPGKRHECPKAGCGSSFTCVGEQDDADKRRRNSDLTRHLKIHQGIRPHQCPEYARIASLH